MQQLGDFLHLRGWSGCVSGSIPENPEKGRRNCTCRTLLAGSLCVDGAVCGYAGQRDWTVRCCVSEEKRCQPKWDSILNKNQRKIALRSSGALDIWMYCATIWQKRWCCGGRSRKRRTFIPEASRRNRATASKLIGGRTAETRFFKARQLVNFNKNLAYM